MKVLLVDDHALIRDALRGVLKELTDDATVLEASDCRQAMRLIEAHPDLHLILLDLNLPDRDGFAVLADLRKRYATISVVVLSAFHDRDNVLRALDLGALGFIPKSAPRDVMVNALPWCFLAASTFRPRRSPAQSRRKPRLPRGTRFRRPISTLPNARWRCLLSLCLERATRRSLASSMWPNRL
jgi:DNA-binding NarL/FixJ family response regulator